MPYKSWLNDSGKCRPGPAPKARAAVVSTQRTPKNLVTVSTGHWFCRCEECRIARAISLYHSSREPLSPPAGKLRDYCTKVMPKLQWRPRDHATSAKESCRCGMDPRETGPRQQNWRTGLSRPLGAETILAQAPDPKWSCRIWGFPCWVSDSLWMEFSFCPILPFRNGYTHTVLLYTGSL